VVREGSEDREVPQGPWQDRVEYAEHWRGPFAYRPEDVLVRGGRGAEAAELAWKNWPSLRSSIRVRPERLGGEGDKPVACERLEGVPDPLRLISDLRVQGIGAQPNHVLFVHCSCCPPHPASGGYGGFGVNPAGINPAGINPAGINPAGINPAGINPAGINPAGINPAGINPAGINPAGINPAGINPNDPFRKTGLRRSSARPAAVPEDEDKVRCAYICTPPRKFAPRVIVLDTGLAGTQPPEVLGKAFTKHSIDAAASQVVDEPDNDANHHLDPAAGHGTFIAGLITQVAPGCTVSVGRVASMYGDTDEFAAATAIQALLVDTVEGPNVDDRTILSLSFGGYAMDDEATALAYAIREFQARGGVVVASAGNDSTCLPAFPAALRDVVSVGAVGPNGPATFTNYGPWVRACAPGVDILSSFFNGFEGKGQPGTEGVDPDDFTGWARWSGTSFSAPIVVGALGRMMMWSKCNAQEAVERIVDAPELLRIPNLGTVVNVI
jgi:hypothetical protein